jgi:hypothetical protein
MRRLVCLVWHRFRGRWLPNVDGYWHCTACHADCFL